MTGTETEGLVILCVIGLCFVVVVISLIDGRRRRKRVKPLLGVVMPEKQDNDG